MSRTYSSPSAAIIGFSQSLGSLSSDYLIVLIITLSYKKIFAQTVCAVNKYLFGKFDILSKVLVSLFLIKRRNAVFSAVKTLVSC